ncbi:MAG: PQQ-binding-like beta-propeller repeat protein [candidate division WOR-3 bacterium]
MKKIIKTLLALLMLIFISCFSNRAPQRPEMPIGSGTAIPNIPEPFSAVSVDPEGDSIAYRFDWGNGIVSNWSAFVASGDTYTTSYTYTTEGNFRVRCQAKDHKGKSSSWSDELLVRCGLGRIRWSFTCPDQGVFNSTAAIDANGNIYVGCECGHLHSFTASGSARWGMRGFVSNTEDEFIASPAIADNGTIYACDRGGYVYALTDNKTLLWQRFLGAEIVGSVAVGRNNEIYVNTIDGFYALSANGQTLWSIDSIQGVSSPTLDSNNFLYVGTSDHYLYCLDTSGTIRWRYALDDEIISSPAVMLNKRICVGCQDGRIYFFHPDTGFILRTSSYGAVSSTPVIGSDGSIYITSEDGYLAKLDAMGNYLWSYPTDGYNTSSPTVVRYPELNQDIIYFKVSWGKKKGMVTRYEDEDSLYMIKADGSRFAAVALPQGYPSEEGLLSSPMIASDGTILIGAGFDEESESGGFFALTGKGNLVNSSWPVFRHDIKNTGRKH